MLKTAKPAVTTSAVNRSINYGSVSITQELRRVSGWPLMGDPTEAHGQCLQSLPKRKPLGANFLPGDM